jgi:hypothetical protein
LDSNSSHEILCPKHRSFVKRYVKYRQFCSIKWVFITIELGALSSHGHKYCAEYLPRLQEKEAAGDFVTRFEVQIPPRPLQKHCKSFLGILVASHVPQETSLQRQGFAGDILAVGSSLSLFLQHTPMELLSFSEQLDGFWFTCVLITAWASSVASSIVVVAATKEDFSNSS